jgi:hypothetical protein
MFAKINMTRLALGVCLAAAWLPIGNGLFQPARANAGEIVRVRPIVRVEPIVPVAPIVRVEPIVPVTPIIRVGPVCPAPLDVHYNYTYWHGYRWVR